MFLFHVFRHNFVGHDTELKSVRQFAENRETVEERWVVDGLVLPMHDPFPTTSPESFDFVVFLAAPVFCLHLEFEHFLRHRIRNQNINTLCVPKRHVRIVALKRQLRPDREFSCQSNRIFV
jgi:hypothetical protein